MAFSHMYDLNDPKITQVMAKEVDDNFDKTSFWTSMSGSDSRYPIFTKQQGREGLVKRKFLNSLLGKGVRDNSDFNTNEDALSYLSMEIAQRIFGNSTISEDLRVELDVRGNHFVRDAVNALSDWYRRNFDRKVFASLSHACTNIAAFSRNNTGLYQIAANQTTQDLCSQITAADTFNLRSLRRALQRARLGIDHTGSRHPKVRPYRVHSKNTEGVNVTQNVFIAILHPMQIAALQDDPDFIMVQSRANERGADNPLISGQIGSIDGCIIVNGSEWDDEILEAGILTSNVQDITDELNTREIAEKGVQQMSIYAGENGQTTACGLLLGGTSLLLSGEFKSKVLMEDHDMKRKKRVALDVYYGMRKTYFTGFSEKEKESFYHKKDFSCMALVSAI